MAVPILTENSILVYDFAYSRSKIPFEKTKRMRHYDDALAFLFACSGEALRKDDHQKLSRPVNKNQSMRQRRIGLESFQILLWALVFGQYAHLYRRRKYA